MLASEMYGTLQNCPSDPVRVRVHHEQFVRKVCSANTIEMFLFQNLVPGLKQLMKNLKNSFFISDNFIYDLLAGQFCDKLYDDDDLERSFTTELIQNGFRRSVETTREYCQRIWKGEKWELGEFT